MISRCLACFVVMALVCVSCSDRPEEPGATSSPVEATETPGDEKDDGSSKNKTDARKTAGKKKRGQEGQGSAGAGDSDESGPSRGQRQRKARGADTGTDAAAAAYPAAGDYDYRQSGFEEFCQATCERQDLPSRQPVSITHKKRSADSAVVVNEARASDNRVVRTTVRFTPDKALITEVFTRFQQGSFSFSDSYHPQPPVESLRFPLRSGTSWSGSWKDKTSGDYSIKVFDREQVSVGGRTVDAFRLQTETTFRGQFDGKSEVTVWFDPETKAVVKNDGMIDVKSSFGRYRSEFQTLLTSGPGY